MALSSGGPKGCRFLFGRRARPFWAHRVEKNVRGKTQEDRDLIEMLDPVAESLGYEMSGCV